MAALVSFCLIAACAPGQTAFQSGSGIAFPSAAGFRAVAVTPATDCRGTGGVTVTPCPIELTKKTKAGIVVTVSGPGVVDSIVEKSNPCFNGKVCVNRDGSGLTQWRITSDKSCGNADIKFLGLNSRHNRVGYALLKVANKYCPQ
jgi:hypothetical protein